MRRGEVTNERGEGKGPFAPNNIHIRTHVNLAVMLEDMISHLLFTSSSSSLGFSSPASYPGCLLLPLLDRSDATGAAATASPAQPSAPPRRAATERRAAAQGRDRRSRRRRPVTPAARTERALSRWWL